MPRFRPPGAPAPFAEVMRPAHFYVGPDLTLEWEHVAAEEISWEIFRGRLLDPAHTRERRDHSRRGTSIKWGRTAGRRKPLLSLKWDAAAGRLYVVRGIDSYVWEGYDSGGGVILSRERRKWVRELVGAVAVADFAGRRGAARRADLSALSCGRRVEPSAADFGGGAAAGVLVRTASVLPRHRRTGRRPRSLL